MVVGSRKLHNPRKSTRQPLHATTVALGFQNATTPSPELHGGDAPIRFYEDLRRNPTVRGLASVTSCSPWPKGVRTGYLSGELDAR